MRPERLRVAVIGGGVAGIATALGLADAGHDVSLLERRPFLGGRVFSFHDEVLGRGLDNGQHAMLGCYRETLALLSRLGSIDQLSWIGLSMELRDGPRRGRLDAGRAPAPFHLGRALFSYRLLSSRQRLAAVAGALRLMLWWRRAPEDLASRTVASALREVGQDADVCRCLWDPIAIAALNIDPSRACAALFAAVVERAFFGRASDAAIVLPGAPLSDVFGDPARRALEEAGVALDMKTRVARIALDADGRASAVVTRDGRRHSCDAIVLATPPPAIASIDIGTARAGVVLGSWVETLAESVPIVSTHLPLEREVDLPPMLGLLGTTTHWVFHTDRFQARAAEGPALLSCVISDAAGLDGRGDDEIADEVVSEVEQHVPEVGRVRRERVRVIREKHATILATVEATAARPGVATSVPGLYLAGDWVDTGLPATIESAAASARLVQEALGSFRRPDRRGAAGAERAA